MAEMIGSSEPRKRVDPDLWVRRVCALVVAGVAAYTSYEHQRDFALRGGGDALSVGLWPLSVDGLLVLDPQQVGQLFLEAGDIQDSARLRELCASLYPVVRGRALLRAAVDDQTTALRTDPSDEVRYTLGKGGGPQVQRAALGVPASWPGLARNPGPRPSGSRRAGGCGDGRPVTTVGELRRTCTSPSGGAF